MRGSKWYTQRHLQKHFKLLMPRFPLLPPGSCVPMRKIEDQIYTGLLRQACGLQILHASHGTGKSTSARAAIRRLQEDKKIAGCQLVDCKVFADACKLDDPPMLSSSFCKYLEREAGLTWNWSGNRHMLQDYFGKFESTPRIEDRVVLLFDQCDHLYSELNENDVRGFLRDLAERSVNNKNFVSLVTISDPELYEKTAKLNGGEKIYDIFPKGHMYRWTDEQISELVLKHVEYDAVFNPSEEEINEMIRLANGRPRAIIKSKDTWLDKRLQRLLADK